MATGVPAERKHEGTGGRERAAASVQQDPSRELLLQERALSQSLGQDARERKRKMQKISDVFQSRKDVTRARPRSQAPRAQDVEPQNDALLMLHETLMHTTTMHCNNGEAPGKARASAAAGVSIGNDRKGKKSRPDTQPQQRTGDEQATALCTLHQV
jgi:hypothetical protein